MTDLIAIVPTLAGCVSLAATQIFNIMPLGKGVWVACVVTFLVAMILLSYLVFHSPKRRLPKLFISFKEKE